MVRLTKAFVRFWYDFIVGDSVVLAIGAPLIMGVAFLLAHSGASEVAQLVLPLGVLATLAVSLALRSQG
jgi:hypothetical protein